MPTSRSYHSYLIESLKNPQEAAAYLEAVLEEGDYQQLRLALNNVAQARIAALNNLQLAEAIEQMLSQQSNIDFPTLLKMLNELGFKLDIRPNWDALLAMTDEEIDYSDIAPLTDEFFENATLRIPADKASNLIELEPDVLAWFKAQGKEYKSLINSVLRRYIHEQ